MADHRTSMVRVLSFRSSALSLAKAFSIGLKSGLWGEVAEFGAGSLDQGAHTRSLVAGQIVHDDDIAGV